MGRLHWVIALGLLLLGPLQTLLAAQSGGCARASGAAVAAAWSGPPAADLRAAPVGAALSAAAPDPAPAPSPASPAVAPPCAAAALPARPAPVGVQAFPRDPPLLLSERLEHQRLALSLFRPPRPS